MDTIPSPAAAPETEPELFKQLQRHCTIPQHFQDYLPMQSYFAPLQQYTSLKPPCPSPIPSASTSSTSSSPLPEPQLFITTEPNTFGVYCQYKTLLLVDPDDSLTIADHCNAPTFSLPPDNLNQCSPLYAYGAQTADEVQVSLNDSMSTNLMKTSESNWFALFLTPTTCRLMHWFYSTTTKTLSDLSCLTTNVLLAPNFLASHLQDFNANHEMKQLDTDSLLMFAADGWTCDHVML